MWCGILCRCLAVKFDSCNNLLSSVHTILVNILPDVRLYIKRKYYSIYPSIYGIYIAPFQGNYSEALPAQANKKVLRRL